jgi:hypothetical protein
VPIADDPDVLSWFVPTPDDTSSCRREYIERCAPGKELSMKRFIRWIMFVFDIVAILTYPVPGKIANSLSRLTIRISGAACRTDGLIRNRIAASAACAC